MTTKADLPALVEELRVVTRPDTSLSPEQRDAQALVYTKRLVAFDPRDVQAAIRNWPTEFWPAWSLLQAAVDDAALKRRQSETVNSNRPRRGEGFVERCLRLGWHAGRLSAISAGARSSSGRRSATRRPGNCSTRSATTPSAPA
jgi:hypothetical protein